jgi:hypothetical protein
MIDGGSEVQHIHRRWKGAHTTHKDIPCVSVAEGKSRVSNEVREAVSAAQQALLAVVVEALLGLLDGGLEGEGRGRAGLVLQRGRVRGRLVGKDAWVVLLHGHTRWMRRRQGAAFYAISMLGWAVPDHRRRHTCLARFSSALISCFLLFAKPLLSLQGVRPEMSAWAASTEPKVKASARAAAAAAVPSCLPLSWFWALQLTRARAATRLTAGARAARVGVKDDLKAAEGGGDYLIEHSISVGGQTRGAGSGGRVERRSSQSPPGRCTPRPARNDANPCAQRPVAHTSATGRTAWLLSTS